MAKDPMQEMKDSQSIVWEADKPEDFQSWIFQGLGTVSVCWESMEGTGIFNSTLAKAVGEAIIEELRNRLATRRSAVHLANELGIPASWMLVELFDDAED